MNGYIVLIEDKVTNKDRFAKDINGNVEIYVMKSKAFRRAELYNEDQTLKVSVYKLTKLNNPNED